MARLHTGRHKELSTYKSYHGATAGAISLTGEGRRWDSEPGVPGAVKFWGPYPYRSAFNATSHAEECERALAHLRATVMAEGPQHIAAILLETVVGTNGILVPPDGYLQGVRELCDEHGILMICDEVMAGFDAAASGSRSITGASRRPHGVAKGVNRGSAARGVITSSRAYTFATRVQGWTTYSDNAGVRERLSQQQHLQRRGSVEHARHLGTDIIGPPRDFAREPRASRRALGSAVWAIEWWPRRRRRRSTRPRWARS